ncbi:MAG: cob(I)yrinic acid a,c-diamide adenosyltransferase [Deltaproteobacteria bacterium]|nr:cob(I)yrinic acid a,c-diamide adenosyltransferase [Deltaproteobacteria bacterium]
MAVKKGLNMIITGRGKGKTTAALGQAFRAHGQGLRVLMLQFIKGARAYGELASAALLPRLSLRPRGLGLIGKSPADLAPHRDAARQAWEEARREVMSGDWDLVILDEIFLAVQRGFVTPAEVGGLMAAKPPDLHLILTGRGCPEELYAQADLVSEIQEVKHHYHSGVPSQAGVEY